MPRAPLPATRRPALARLLKRERNTIAEALIQSLRGFAKYDDALHAHAEGDTEMMLTEVGSLVDFLALLFQTGDATYRDLYIGEKRKIFYDEALTPEHHRENARRILDLDTQALLAFAEKHASSADVATLERELAEISSVLTAEAARSLKVLLVGDCLFLDLLAFVTVPLLNDGITLEPTFATLKNPVTLRESLRKLTGPFDLVFYSPFTYQFSLDYAFTSNYRNALSTQEALQHVVNKAVSTAEETTVLLADLHECPIFVHNSADVRRHDSRPAEVAKCLLTQPVRKKARALLKDGIASMVGRVASAGATNVHVLDETRLLSRAGELELGRKYYDSPLQHPTVFSKVLATEYQDIVAARAHLLGKKIIVTDLDNTLWRGVIGEGEVVQFTERQALLRRLRLKGILLAVASKNDPARVRWNEMLLSDDDFVAKRVDWRPKVVNIKELKGELELRPDAFVFVDDRPDERALVEAGMPGLRALDAEDERSWRRLEIWETLLGSGQQEDRTRWYREREQRGAALDAARERGEENAFAMLELRAAIRRAASADVARVAELINRSNQFNLCGSRTSQREVRSWIESNDHHVLVADVSDRFGAMGVVGIAVVKVEPGRLIIPAFVLSCRVFGYAVETALLTTLVRFGGSGDANGPCVVGHYRETPANAPGRAFYADHGFTRDGETWVHRGALTVTPPDWLTVVDETHA